MFLRTESLTSKKLIGMKMLMSQADNKTPGLWKNFMRRRKEITSAVGTVLFSMQLYPSTYFDSFNPGIEFIKWAAVEVKDFDIIPEGMESFDLPEGLYAVFLHKGAPSEGVKTFQYIFQRWLPGSDFRLDNRPHFELLGEKYKHDDPTSEEEIWIPIH
jgi:AraC family transcriptional regulator